MAERKPVMGPTPSHPELDLLLEQTRSIKVTESDLMEQRVSFAYGNASHSSNVTKESVRDATKTILLG
jgi:hypothetical protein